MEAHPRWPQGNVCLLGRDQNLARFQRSLLSFSPLLQFRSGNHYIQRGSCAVNLAQKVAISVLVEGQTANVNRHAVVLLLNHAQDRNWLIAILDDDGGLVVREELVSAGRKLFASYDKVEGYGGSNLAALRLQTIRREEARQHNQENGCNSLHGSLLSRRRLGVNHRPCR